MLEKVKMFIYIFLVTILQLTNFAEATVTEIYKYEKITPTTCGPQRLSLGWVDKSRLSCAVKCKARFQWKCHSFMYNKDTKLCTPASLLSHNEPLKNTSEGDLYLNDFFRVINEGNITLNVAYLTEPLNYTDAESACQCLDGHLLVIDSLDKFRLLGAIMTPPYFTWIGLDDMAVEDSFKWVNSSRVIDPVLKTSIFKAGQPDNGYGGNQDCGAVAPDSLMLDDAECEHSMSYICERPLL